MVTLPRPLASSDDHQFHLPVPRRAPVGFEQPLHRFDKAIQTFLHLLVRGLPCGTHVDRIPHHDVQAIRPASSWNREEELPCVTNVNETERKA